MDQESGRRFAVGAGDADDFQIPGRKAPLQVGGDRHPVVFGEDNCVIDVA